MPETETLKERSEMDPQYQWDLSSMYKDDAAWEHDFATLDEQVQAMTAFAGTLKNAVSIGAYLDAGTELSRKLSNLYCYASMRRSEDTRAEAGQSMYARITAKYVQAIFVSSCYSGVRGAGMPGLSRRPRGPPFFIGRRLLY